MAASLTCPICGSLMVRENRYSEGFRKDVNTAECVNPCCGFGMKSFDPIDQKTVEDVVAFYVGH